LGWLGSQAADEPFITISRLSTFIYFAYFGSSCVSFYGETFLVSLLSKKK
jgi:hypothetical protein